MTEINPSASPREDFNAASQKIIQFDEFDAKAKALYKAELTFRERVLLHTVEQPLSQLSGAFILVRQFISPAFNQQLRAATGDCSEGLYKGAHDGAMYLNTAVIPVMEKQFTLTPKLTKKANDLDLRAIAECKDYSDLRAKGLLKPL